MTNQIPSIIILTAEDDPDDQVLVRDAFLESGQENTLLFVQDGNDLLQFLRQRGRYAEPGEAPRPDLILLDLNMPGMGGKEFLRQIKKDDALSPIPVVVVTTSDSEADIKECYELQAAGYIQKAAVPAEFNEILKKLVRYWFLTSAVLRV